MSGIEFTTRDGRASVRGTERAYGAALAARLTAAVLDLNGRHTQERNRRILPELFLQQAEFERYRAQKDGRTSSLTETFTYWAPMSAMMHEDGEADMRIGDQTQRVDAVVINTGVVAGSDPIALLTRLHGYVDEGIIVAGSDRAWLAAIIDVGLQAHILRDEPGWTSAAELLRDDDRSPVVITTSSGASLSWLQGSALGIYAADQTDQERWAAQEEFEAIPVTERWDRTIGAMIQARNSDGHWWLTFSPETFHEPSHCELLTAFDAVAAANRASADTQ